jgi:2-hydroxy-3-oxopropionate reductase
LERARPVLEVLGATIVHCGPAGAGQVVKVCDQVVVGVVIGAVSEALVLMRAARANERADFDHSGLVTVLEDLAGCRVADAVKT